MRTSQGVEWATHTCINLSWMDRSEGVPTAKLADFYQLPPAYLSKQLGPLVRAGILSSTSGPRGGFVLGRAAESTSLMDVTAAIEGADRLFRCDQILRQGPGGRHDVDYRESCLVSQAMLRAELEWRKVLAAQSIADLADTVERRFPGTRDKTRKHLARTS